MTQRPSLPGVEELFGDTIGSGRADRRHGGVPADVADDLRDPLHALRGFATILDQEQGRRLDADGRRMLQQIRSIADDLLALVDELDDAVMCDDELLPGRRERRDLRVLVGEVVAGRRVAAEGAQVTIAVRPGVRPAVALVDAAQVRRILDDLLTAAVTASPHRVGAEVVTSIAVTSRDVLVAIASEGGGRFDASRTPPTPLDHDAGPRLAVAWDLARAHDGDLEVASLAGGGTTWTLRLPRQT